MSTLHAMHDNELYLSGKWFGSPRMAAELGMNEKHVRWGLNRMAKAKQIDRKENNGHHIYRRKPEVKVLYFRTRTNEECGFSTAWAEGFAR